MIIPTNTSDISGYEAAGKANNLKCVSLTPNTTVNQGKTTTITISDSSLASVSVIVVKFTGHILGYDGAGNQLPFCEAGGTLTFSEGASTATFTNTTTSSSSVKISNVYLIGLKK